MPADPAPRWLDRRALATYISVRIGQISRLQKAGKLPEPSRLLGPRTPRWDRLKVDALFLESDAEARQADVDAAVAQVVEEILAGGIWKRPPRKKRAAP